MTHWIVDLMMHSLFLSFIVAGGFTLIYHQAKKEKRKGILHVFLFAFYMCNLFYITVVREGFFTNETGVINLIPMVQMLENYKHAALQYPLQSFMYLVYNILGNIVWFMPFGYMLHNFVKRISLKKVILYSFMLSFYIELGQYVLRVGISDIDDIILNTLGGMLGYIVYRWLHTERKKDEH
ncbi:hypothetical protein A4S06_08130 [Erysipelotrichaceae bacterium MTC7]|nr:hypothetical protein A4S06_08130 [Erysipelotrichaceae bacterium MTC7]